MLGIENENAILPAPSGISTKFADIFVHMRSQSVLGSVSNLSVT